jgi:tetratricopeptide (TPR) repeat protein
MLLFLVTTVVAVWAAYNQPFATAKAWLHVGAVLLFYAIALQRPTDLWIVAGIWSFFGLFIASYDLLTHNWADWPAKVAPLQQMGLNWMALRPQLRLPYAHPNFVAGVTSAMLPFVVALAVRSWRRRRVLSALLLAAGAVLILLLVVLSTTRGVWVALAVTTAMLILWAFCLRLAPRQGWEPRRLFVAILMGLAVVLLLVLAIAWIVAPQPVSALVDFSTRTRLDQNGALLNLIEDFPLTGGGLNTFPGLYSWYIRVTPQYIWPHGHNTYGDIALEQGLLAFFALAWIAVASIWWLLGAAQQGPEKLLALAALSSLSITLIHGLVSDNIYHSNMAVFMFVVPGIAVALRAALLDSLPAVTVPPAQPSRSHRRWAVLAAALAVFLVLGFLFRQQALATWYANLGATRMARIELARYGSGQWDDAVNVAALAPAEQLFTRALDMDPRNGTAYHRLGLIALQRLEFPEAVRYLEQARALDPGHWGISKALAYAYAWTGQYDRAAPLMQWNPDIEEELAGLTLRWRSVGRDDLAGHAEAMSQALASWPGFSPQPAQEP